jgi:hypothetical protein
MSREPVTGHALPARTAVPSAGHDVPVPPGYAPVTGVPSRDSIWPLPSTDMKVAYAAAFKIVVLQVMTEAFDLFDEEHMWLGFHLDTMFSPLLDLTPHTVPLPVRQEAQNGTYSRQLELRHRAKTVRGQAVFNANVLQATREDWASALLNPVFASYVMRPLSESSMRGQMLGLLAELGIGDPGNPRGALFLPTDLRLQII